MYFVEFDRMSGKLIALDMVPLQIRWFLLNHASNDGIDWLRRHSIGKAKSLVRRSSADWWSAPTILARIPGRATQEIRPD